MTRPKGGAGARNTIPYVAHPNFANVKRGLSAPAPLALPRGYFWEDEWAGRWKKAKAPEWAFRLPKIVGAQKLGFFVVLHDKLSQMTAPSIRSGLMRRRRLTILENGPQRPSPYRSSRRQYSPKMAWRALAQSLQIEGEIIRQALSYHAQVDGVLQAQKVVPPDVV